MAVPEGASHQHDADGGYGLEHRSNYVSRIRKFGDERGGDEATTRRRLHEGEINRLREISMKFLECVSATLYRRF
jgi:hypothetical protein